MAHGPHRGKTQERKRCVFNDCKKRMLNRMKICVFSNTASERSERAEIFRCFVRKNGSTSSSVARNLFREGGGMDENLDKRHIKRGPGAKPFGR